MPKYDMALLASLNETAKRVLKAELDNEDDRQAYQSAVSKRQAKLKPHSVCPSCKAPKTPNEPCKKCGNDPELGDYLGTFLGTAPKKEEPKRVLKAADGSKIKEELMEWVGGEEYDGGFTFYTGSEGHDVGYIESGKNFTIDFDALDGAHQVLSYPRTPAGAKAASKILIKELDPGYGTKASLKASEDEWSVNVGNVGNIACENEAEARETYKEYVSQSSGGKGRAGGEEVNLLHNGEPVETHLGDHGLDASLKVKAEDEDDNTFVMVTIDVEVRKPNLQDTKAWEGLKPGNSDALFSNESLAEQLGNAVRDFENIHFVEAQVSDKDGNLG